MAKPHRLRFWRKSQGKTKGKAGLDAGVAGRENTSESGLTGL